MVWVFNRFRRGDLRGSADALDKSVSFSDDDDGDSAYGSGAGLRGKCVRSSEQCIFENGVNFCPCGKSGVIRIAISHVGDLLISGTDGSIRFLTGRLHIALGRKVF